MKEKLQNRIDQYLSDKMSKDERIEFEKELKDDEILNEKVNLQKEIVEQIRNRAFVDRQLANARKELNKGRKTLALRIGMSIAAMFVGFIVVSGVIQNKQMDQLYTQSFSAYENDLGSAGIFRGDMSLNESDSLLNMALHEYDNKNFQEAIVQFDRIVGKFGENNSIQFYKAVSLMANKKHNEALIVFNDLYQLSDDFAYYEETRWYLALIYLKEHKKKKAKTLLHELVLFEGYYFDKAKMLIESL